MEILQYSSKIWVVTNTKNDLIKYPVDESDCFTIYKIHLLIFKS